MQARGGTLYSNKLGKRYGHCTSSACPLCGQEDGGGHIASGCPALTRLYMSRHHAAGRIIVKAVGKGAMGASSFRMLDIGSREKLAEAGITLDADTTLGSLPPTLITPAETQAHLTEWRGPQGETRRLSRPDAIMVTEGGSTSSPTQRSRLTIQLLEIKYGRDTGPAPQEANAVSQHTDLQAALLEIGYTDVRIVPIVLGWAGTIHTANLTTLQQLGVDPAAACKALRKAHLHAVHALRSIVSTRWHLVRERGAGGHRPPPRVP
jgi:hypothetical protein